MSVLPLECDDDAVVGVSTPLYMLADRATRRRAFVVRSRVRVTLDLLLPVLAPPR